MKTTLFWEIKGFFFSLVYVFFFCSSDTVSMKKFEDKCWGAGQNWPWSKDGGAQRVPPVPAQSFLENLRRRFCEVLYYKILLRLATTFWERTHKSAIYFILGKFRSSSCAAVCLRIQLVSVEVPVRSPAEIQHCPKGTWHTKKLRTKTNTKREDGVWHRWEKDACVLRGSRKADLALMAFRWERAGRAPLCLLWMTLKAPWVFIWGFE